MSFKRRVQPDPSDSGYKCCAMRPMISSVGVEKFEDRFAAATICAPLVRSYIVTVLKPKIAPSCPIQSPKRRMPSP